MSKQGALKRDETATVAELKAFVEKFVVERNWAQFHSPKNVAMAIGVEAGELMDLFRWHSESQSTQAMRTGKVRTAAIEELADVVICALSFANRSRIDIAQAVRCKIIKNSKKYPVNKYKGRF